MKRCDFVTVVLAILLACAAQARAQGGPAIDPAFIGDCHVTVQVAAAGASGKIDVSLNKHLLTRQDLGSARQSIVVILNGPLQDGDEVAVRIGTGAWTSAPVQARPAGTAAECEGPERPTFDDRAAFEASAYYGRAFDNFAPDSIGNYIRPDQTAGIKSRYIVGTDVQYRLFGKSTSDVQLWLSAETLHGVRTGDIDCRTSDSALCSDKDLPKQKFLAVLEGQTSLEAFFNPRLEFATLQRSSGFPVKLYLTARLGFIDVENGPKVFRDDHFGGGLIAPTGPFAGSSAEIGWGKTELIDSNPGWHRLKIDGTLMFDLMPGLADRLNVFQRMGGATRGFVEIYIDQSLGSGPDSVQTFVGVSFDFRSAFGK